MNKKEQLIDKIMKQVDNGHIGGYERDYVSQDFTLLQKGFIKHLLESELPEDNEGDVVEIIEENEHDPFNYKPQFSK